MQMETKRGFSVSFPIPWDGVETDFDRLFRETDKHHYERERHNAQIVASVWMAVAEQVKEW